MTSFHSKLLFATVVLLFSGTSSAWAQYPRPSHYYPSRPPISPYFGYSQVNTTGVPSYYTFVRPAQEQAALYSRTYSRTNAYYAAPRTAINESLIADMVVDRLDVRQTTGIGAPSVPATFQDRMHFYPQPVIGRR
jgi:hypothetical protein